MQLPLNAIHWYIGWPFFLIVALRSFAVRDASINSLNRLFGWSALTWLACFTVYAVPPLLTTDSNVLTLSTIAGDTLQFVALFLLWVAVARVYLPQLRWARLLVIVADAIVVLIGVAITAQVNLANPVTLTYVDGAWSINYVVSMGYQVVSAIQYASLLFLAARFWVQSLQLTSPAQKIRLRAFAVGFLVIGGTYVSRPFFGSDTLDMSTSVLVAFSMVVTGVFIGATIYLARRKMKIS